MHAPNRRRGGVLSGLLVAALAIAALLVIGGLMIARNVRVISTARDNGGDVSIDVPGGHIDVSGHKHLDPASLGIPIYPGAEQNKEAGGASFAWSSSDGKEDKELAVAGADFVTADDADKVLAYYRAQLPTWSVVNHRDGSTEIELDKDGYKRIVGIKEKRDGTHIGVATVGRPAAN